MVDSSRRTVLTAGVAAAAASAAPQVFAQAQPAAAVTGLPAGAKVGFYEKGGEAQAAQITAIDGVVGDLVGAGLNTIDYLGSGTTIGSANAYLLTVPGKQAAYANGQFVVFKANFDNANPLEAPFNAVTINITNGDGIVLGIKAIREDGDQVLAPRSIQSGGHYHCRYDAAANSGAGAWILLNPSRSGITGPLVVYPIDDYNRWNRIILSHGTGPKGEGAGITGIYQLGPVDDPLTTPLHSELGFIQYAGWDGESFGLGVPNAIVCSPIENFSPTNHGAGWIFQATGLGQASAQNEMSVVDGVTLHATPLEHCTPGRGLGTLDAKNGLYTAGILDISAATAGQIKFPATQNPSANANTFDDYERGTFTPVLTFATPGDLSVTYTAQVGVYTKLGRLVNVSMLIVTSTFTHTSASGTCALTGLPFTSANVSFQNAYGSAQLSGVTKAPFTQFQGIIGPNTSQLIIGASTSGVSASTVAAADVPTGGTVVIGSTLTYTT